MKFILLLLSALITASTASVSLAGEPGFGIKYTRVDGIFRPVSRTIKIANDYRDKYFPLLGMVSRDINRDGLEELIGIVGNNIQGGRISVLRWEKGDFTEVFEGVEECSVENAFGLKPQVTAGDFDGNGLEEILAFSFVKQDDQSYYSSIESNPNRSNRSSEINNPEEINCYEWRNKTLKHTGTIDKSAISGQREMLLFTSGDIYGNGSSKLITTVLDGPVESIYSTDPVEYLAVFEKSSNGFSEIWNSRQLFSGHIHEIAVGDIDGDKRDEIVFYSGRLSGKYIFGNIQVIDFEDSGFVLKEGCCTGVLSELDLKDLDEDGRDELIFYTRSMGVFTAKIYGYENGRFDELTSIEVPLIEVDIKSQEVSTEIQRADLTAVKIKKDEKPYIVISGGDGLYHLYSPSAPGRK